MKVVKEVEFTKEELVKARDEALCKAASVVIGEPDADERFEVEFCSWRDSATVRIVKKDEGSKEQ
jgi:hypothetical protein